MEEEKLLLWQHCHSKKEQKKRSCLLLCGMGRQSHALGIKFLQQIGEAERCCNVEGKSVWEKCLIQDSVYLRSGNFWNKLIYNTFYGLCILFHAVFGDGNQSIHVPFGALIGVSTHKAEGDTSVATQDCRMCTWASHTGRC